MKTLKRMISFMVTAAMIFSLSVWSVSAEDGSTPAEKKTTLDWTQFLGNEELKGVSDSKTPRALEEMELLWKSKKNWNGSVKANSVTYQSTPVILGDYVYYCITDPNDIADPQNPTADEKKYKDKRIIKAKAEDGTIVARSAPFSNTASQLLPTIGSGGGMIYAIGCDASMSGSRIYAFDQDTLELVWKTEPMTGQQVEGHILYHDGYVYASTYWQGGGMYCYDVKAQAGADGIAPKWKMIVDDSNARKGFLWADVEFVGDACVFAHTNGTIYSVNRITGEPIDTVKIPDEFIAASTTAENITTTPYYYPKNNRLYVSLAGAYGGIISYVMNEDGSFNKGTQLIYKGEANQGIKSSVIIYNDRLYVCGGGGHGGSAAPFMVLNANTLEKYYEITEIASKGSMVMTTAYATEENNQEVYLYVVPYSYGRIQNNTKVDQGLYIIKDSVGQTQPSYEKIILDQEFEGVVCENSSHTMAVDRFGHIYVNNDSGQFWVFGKKDAGSAKASDASKYTAADVMNQIARQPEVGEFKYYNRFELRRIMERYNGLSAEEQAKVTNLDKLTEMIEVSVMLPEERIDQINAGIANLPAVDQITMDQVEIVEGLYHAYSQMTEEIKQKVVGADKLNAAYARVQELRNDASVADLIAAIDQLPAADKLSLAQEAVIDSLIVKLNALPDESAQKVSNAAKLTAAKDRMEAIHAQLRALDTYINEKLAFADITLDSKSLLDGALELTEGLLMEDLLTINSYEQYFVPALTDFVNLKIEQLTQDGTSIDVTADNAAQVQKLLDEIETYYGALPENAVKYVRGYETVTDLQKKAGEYLDGNDRPLSPETGSRSNYGIYLCLLILSGLSVLALGACRLKQKIW